VASSGKFVIEKHVNLWHFRMEGEHFIMQKILCWSLRIRKRPEYSSTLSQSMRDYFAPSKETVNYFYAILDILDWSDLLMQEAIHFHVADANPLIAAWKTGISKAERMRYGLRLSMPWRWEAHV
jgi:hypothetical protein